MRKSTLTRYKLPSISIVLTIALILAMVFVYRTQATEETLGLSYKAASQPALAPGETLTYTIHLVNNSTTPAKANVSDKIPAELIFTLGTASNGGVYNSAQTLLTWDQIAVPAQSEVVLSFDVTSAVIVQEETQVVNKASIQVIAEDGLGQILTRAASVKILPGELPPPTSLVNAFKLASQPTLAPGATLTYTILITNSGVNPETVSVTDLVPNELAFIEGSQSGDGLYDPVLKMISWRSVEVPAMSEVELTFDVKTAQDVISSPSDVTNRASVTWGDKEFNPEVKITLVSAPLHYDVTRPVVNQVTIGSQDVVSDPQVQLHIDASADAVWMFVREYVVKSVNGIPVWAVDHSSGWLPFEADYAWNLGNSSGVHYIGVAVADQDRIHSALTHQSFDFVSLNLPDTQTQKPELIPYLVYYDAGADVNIQLTPTAGNADIYVWYPGNFYVPDQVSLATGTATDQVSFTTPKAGIYIFLIHALSPVSYNLSITPPGGPIAPVTGLAETSGFQSATAGAFAFEPVFTNPMGIGLDPLGSAAPIPFNVVNLPMVQR